MSEEGEDFFLPTIGDGLHSLLSVCLWFPSVTMGTFFNLAVIGGIKNDQYSTLVRQLQVGILTLNVWHNVCPIWIDIIRQFYGPLPSYVCTFAVHWKYSRFMLTYLLAGEGHLLRILYCTVWSNVGYLNDQFALNFVHSWNTLLTFHLCVLTWLLEDHRNLRYFICTGITPKKGPNTINTVLTHLIIYSLVIMVIASIVSKTKRRHWLRKTNGVGVQGLSQYVPPKRTFGDLLNLKMLQVPLIALALIPEIYFSFVPWDVTLNSGFRSTLLVASQFFYHFVLGFIIPLTYVIADDKIYVGYLQLRRDTVVWIMSKFRKSHRLSEQP